MSSNNFESACIMSSIEYKKMKETDEMFANEYAELFPNLPEPDGPPPEDQDNDEIDTLYLYAIIVDRYMEMWGRECKMPEFEMLYEEIECEYLENLEEIINSEYQEDEQYQEDFQYQEDVQEMYFETFMNITHFELRRKIEEALNYYNLTYIDCGEAQIKTSDGSTKTIQVSSKLYNGAQNKFFIFPFSDVIEV